ncbi:MAG: YbhB/YbcL family Raf kinase inhibitor-like protein [Labilithrix sp.]|nr:YbhB/YbcL family Raf kinase inhibitor-like protein [Labilithrix sp.]
MGLAHDLQFTLGRAIAPLRAGDETLASRRLGVVPLRTIDVTSSAFTDGGSLPRAFTTDGAGVPPTLAWSNVPAGTCSIVVIAEDPDAPTPSAFVHWLVYGMPAEVSGIAPGHAHLEGKNSLLTDGFTPAAPPAGHGIHHYHFQVFALDTVIDLEQGAGRSTLLEEMRDHVLAWGEIVATYERS